MLSVWAYRIGDFTPHLPGKLTYMSPSLGWAGLLAGHGLQWIDSKI